MATNKDAPFGMRAIGKVGQNNDNQGLSEYNIAASAPAIFQNDAVKAINTATIAQAAAGDTLIGTLTGVFFTDANTNKPTFANHLKASNTATDIVGFISDDPYERFEIQSNAALALTSVFLNADIEVTAGTTANFQSKSELNASTVTTSTAQLRILGVTKDAENNNTSNVTTFATNANFVCSINEHFLKGTVGV